MKSQVISDSLNSTNHKDRIQSINQVHSNQKKICNDNQQQKQNKNENKNEILLYFFLCFFPLKNQ